MPSLVLKPFTRYRITYATTDPDGKDYARIDLFKGATKVGQVLFGSAIAPGSFAAVVGQQIHLYFPLSHFDTIRRILREERNLSLCLDTAPRRTGGIANNAQPF